MKAATAKETRGEEGKERWRREGKGVGEKRGRSRAPTRKVIHTHKGTNTGMDKKAHRRKPL